MSLVALATRWIVCRAIAAGTFPADRVLNSPVEPLDTLLAEDPPTQPLIAVFCSQTAQKADGRDLSGGENKVKATG